MLANGTIQNKIINGVLPGNLIYRRVKATLYMGNCYQNIMMILTFGTFRNLPSPRIKCKYIVPVVLLGLMMPLLLFENRSDKKQMLGTKSKKSHTQKVVEYLSRSDCVPVKGHWRTKRYAAKLPHCFDEIISNDHICSDAPNLLLLVYVYSAPQDFKKRQAIRATYGSKTILDGKTVRVVFPLGLPQVKNKKINRKILQEGILAESNKYKDIIQEGFIESYRNLTYKGIMTLRWIDQHCSHAKFVLKADSDVFVNIYALLTFLKMQPDLAKKKIIGCEFYTHMRVIRCSARPDLKSCTTSDQFKGAYYPRYCQGAAFLLTMHTAKAMHQASLNTPIWWVDDVFITGIIMRKIKNVKRVGFKKSWVRSTGRTLKKLKKNPTHILFAAVRGPVQMAMAWKVVNDGVGQYQVLQIGTKKNTEKTPAKAQSLKVIDLRKEDKVKKDVNKELPGVDKAETDLDSGVEDQQRTGDGITDDQEVEGEVGAEITNEDKVEDAEEEDAEEEEHEDGDDDEEAGETEDEEEYDEDEAFYDGKEGAEGDDDHEDNFDIN